MKRFLLGFAVFCFCHVLAQEPYALLLDKKAGLPSQSVYNIHQDKAGFIWIASDVGLTRYDGFRFETFYCEEQTSFSGSCIKEDKYGRIWYENFDGYLYYVDPNSLEMKALNDANCIGYMPFGVTQNHLLHLDTQGISVYDLKTLKKVKTFGLKMYNPQHTAHSNHQFYFLDEGVLTTVNEDLSKKTVKIEVVGRYPHQIFSLTDSLFVILPKFDQNKELHFYDASLKVIKKIDISDVQLIHHINFIDNLLWISSPSGTHVYDLNGKKINQYFSNLSISCVLKDRQNNYWFSSTNQGVLVVPKLDNKFMFGGDQVPSKIVPYTNGSYLISTKKGEIFQVNKFFEIIRTLVSEKEMGEIFFLNYDKTNDILSYTANRFAQINATTLKTQTSPSYSIKDIALIDNKYYAFAASNVSGIYIKDEKMKSKWDTYLGLRNEFDVLVFFLNLRSRSVAYDSVHEKIYFATNVGLYEISTGNKRELLYKGKSFFASKLTMFDGNLYALSTKGNMYKIDEKGNFELLNTKYGIAEYDIRFMRNFEKSLVFASTSYVYQLDWFTKKLKTFDLNISEFDINDLFVEDDILYLLINKGVIQTSLNVEQTEELEPKFVINHIRSKDLKYSSNEQVVLKHDYNEVKIEYSILDFGKSIPSSLYYRVNQGAWNKTSPLSRELNFPKLEAGSYTIDFKFKDSQIVSSFSFTLLKPWWKGLWFILSFIFLVSLLAYLYYRSRVKILSDKNKLLEENVQLEKNLRHSVLTTIKSQMNPHFLYNALNTIQAYIYSNDKENAGKYLIKFSKLTRKVLEMSELETVGLDEELETIQLYLDLEKARFDDDFTVVLNTPEIEHFDDIKVPPMLIQPYIENAIKHGLLHKNGEKILEINLTEKENFLIVVIDDNGIGRKRSGELNKIKAKSHKSFASDANLRRLEVLNHAKNNKFSVQYVDKMDDFGNSLGTTVEIKIPLNK